MQLKHNIKPALNAAGVALSIVLLSNAQMPISEPAFPETPAELGALLFQDPILSKDSTISCASCHKPEFGFADNQAFSMGVTGLPTARNTPSITYMKSRAHFFWDGRAPTLEAQAVGPITNPNEMGLPIGMAVKRLQANPFYQEAFQQVFYAAPDSLLLLKSLSEFERTLQTYDSPYDRFLAGEDTAMSEAAIRGFTLFFKENNCSNEPCHAGIDFSHDSIVAIGVSTAADQGLSAHTGNPSDSGKFKTPHLRNIALTAPYMHDGSQKTLREVVVFYNDMSHFPKESKVHPLLKSQRTRPMTDAEIDDMVAFLNALTDKRYLINR